MHAHYRILAIVLLGFGAAVFAGCNAPSRSGTLAFWPFNRGKSDAVPGIPSPAERVAKLRKMGEKAAWAKPEEQERISRELAAAFQDEPDPIIRLEIVRAIGEYRTDAATSVLDTALKDSEPDVRMVACQAWGKHGGPRAAAKLSEVLRTDVDLDVRLTAARALGETGESGAVAALGESLEERDPAMQYQAVQSLRNVTGEDLSNDVNQWRRYVKGEPLGRSEPVSITERIRGLFYR
jgi:hypothetical protein